MTKRLLLLLTLCLATAGLVASAPAGAAAVPAGATWEEIFFPSLDGTMLNGELLRPENGCPAGGCPVIVSTGPYYGQSTQDFPVVNPLEAGPSGRFYDFIAHEYPGRGNIFQQGYAWLAVDSRGYGESGGCNDYGGIGEQMDAAAAVEWAGTQDWSNGKVGMWGKSYDAWTQVMALAMNPPHLEAVVIQSPIIEGYGIAYVNGVHHDAGWYATTGLYQGYDYAPPSLGDPQPEEFLYPASGMTDPCWEYQHAMIAAGWDRDGLPAAEYWRERDLRPRARANDDVAVLWSHGFNDVNTKPDQIFGVYDGLTASPRGAVRAWFGEWAHDRGNQSELTGRRGFLEEALDWFDHYLKGQPFRYSVNANNIVEVQDNEGAWRTESVYPPADVRRVVVPLLDGSYVDNNNTRAPDNGYWTVSQPVVDEFRITGESTLTVTADIVGTWANLVAILYDYDPDTGSATEISRGAYRFEGDGPVSFNLHPRDHIMRAGHQLAFHMTAAHPEFLPHPSGTTVNITDASVSMPVPLHDRESNLRGDPAAPSSGGARVVRPPVAQITAGALEMPLPETIPFPDAATREAHSPTITDDPGGPHTPPSEEPTEEPTED